MVIPIINPITGATLVYTYMECVLMFSECSWRKGYIATVYY